MSLKTATFTKLLLTIVFFGAGSYLWSNLSLFTPKISPTYCPPNQLNNTLVLGDSWTAGASFQLPLHEVQAKTNFLSFPGSTSKKVLEAVVHDELLKEKLKSGYYKQVILVTGVNDVAGGYGQDFYAHHMNMLNHFFNQYCVATNMLELPFIYLPKIERSLLGKMKLIVFSLVMQDDSTDLIQSYRLATNTIKNVNLIPYPLHLSNYHVDPAHLNDEGNKQLAIWIKEHINVASPNYKQSSVKQ